MRRRALANVFTSIIGATGGSLVLYARGFIATYSFAFSGSSGRATTPGIFVFSLVDDLSPQIFDFLVRVDLGERLAMTDKYYTDRKDLRASLVRMVAANLVELVRNLLEVRFDATVWIDDLGPS